jgi:hypothetical protein
LCHAQGKKVFLASIRLAPIQDGKTQVHNVPGKPTSGPKPDRLDLGYISGLHGVILHLMSLPHHNSYRRTSHVRPPSSRRVQYIAPTVKRPGTSVRYRWRIRWLLPHHMATFRFVTVKILLPWRTQSGLSLDPPLDGKTHQFLLVLSLS